MIKIMKKCFILFLFVSIVCGASDAVYADEDKIVVEINEINFPDDVFREHILTGSHYVWDEEGNQIQIVYDANQDGKLSESEIASIQQLLLPQMAIYDLTGIEYFTALIELDCQYTHISTLDVSHNTELQYLNCYYTNMAGTLDLSNNTKLIGVCCHHSFLDKVIVNNCTELENLNIESTEVSAIDLSDNSKLSALNCGDTSLRELDLSNNPALKTLSCYKTAITTLDISHNPLLIEADCSNNTLESIDVSQNKNLVTLKLSFTSIQGVDVSGHDNLRNLLVLGNSFVWLNVGDNANMSIAAGEGMAELTVPEDGFDITECFPGIEAEKITIVSGGTLEGNIISEYEEGTPVVYHYNCGTINNEEVIITAALNLNVDSDDPATESGNDTDDPSTEPGGDDDDSSTKPGGDDDDPSTKPGGDDDDPSTKPGGDDDDSSNVPEDGDEESSTPSNTETAPDTGDHANVMVLLPGIVIPAVILTGIIKKKYILKQRD